MIVPPEQLQHGDRFTHRGIVYEVVGEPARGRYSTFDVPVRRLSRETVAFDYTDKIAVDRVGSVAGGEA